MSKEYSFFPLSTSKMFTFPTWVLVDRFWESGEKAKVHASTGPASTDFLYLLFSNCQRRIWASTEWDAAMGRVWLKSTNNTLSWGLSRFHCRSSFSSRHFQTFTWSSRDPMTTVSESSLFDPQATDQMASSWVCSSAESTVLVGHFLNQGGRVKGQTAYLTARLHCPAAHLTPSFAWQQHQH